MVRFFSFVCLLALIGAVRAIDPCLSFQPTGNEVQTGHGLKLVTDTASGTDKVYVVLTGADVQKVFFTSTSGLFVNAPNTLAPLSECVATGVQAIALALSGPSRNPTAFLRSAVDEAQTTVVTAVAVLANNDYVTLSTPVQLPKRCEYGTCPLDYARRLSSDSKTLRRELQSCSPDTIAPAITCPGNQVISADAACVVVDTTLPAATATDTCDANPVMTNDAAATYAPGTYTVTYVATDAASNTASCSYTLTVQDNTPPLFDYCPDSLFNVVAGPTCTVPIADVTLGTPTVSDNCVANTPTLAGEPASAYPYGTTVLTYTDTDAAGNSNTCVQTVNVVDLTPPSITCPADFTHPVETGACAVPVSSTNFASSLAFPTTSDNCGGVSVVSNAPELFNVGVTIVKYTATDDVGNQATCNEVVTIVDDQDPVISACPNDFPRNVNSVCEASSANLGSVSVTDNCGVASITNNAPLVFSGTGDRTVTWTVMDPSNNGAACQQTVTLVDATNPKILCPGSLFADAAVNVCQAVVATGSPVTSDNCAVASVVATLGGNAIGPIHPFGIGVNTVTWTVKDGVDNQATCDQIVTVVDRTPPTIYCPTDVTASSGAGCTVALAAITLGTPAVNDNCDQANAMTPTNNAPSTFFAGTTIVTWSVVDSAGNRATCQQRVTVSDSSAPTISCPAAAALTASSGCKTSPSLIGAATGADNCGNPSITTNAPVEWTAVGSYTVTHTATDKSGNTATCDQTVVITDNSAPAITCPSSLFQSIGADCTVTVNLGNPTAVDNCAVASTTAALGGVAIADPAAKVLTGPGSSPVVWTVTDGASLTATCSQTVTIVDNTKPTITCPADVTVSSGTGCTKALADITLGTPTTADNCQANTPTNDAPATFYTGSTYVTWTVTDPAGNYATCEQRVIVQDTSNPTITCPTAVTLNAGTNCRTSASLMGTATSTDNCGTPTLTTNAPGEWSATGVFTVTHTATDKSGNTATCDQTVTVVDSSAPAIICPNVVFQSAGADCKATINLGAPTPSDNCAVASAAATLGGAAIADPAAKVFDKGTSSVVWTVTDGASLTATCSQTVTIVDSTKPTVTCPADVEVSSGTGCTVALADVTLGTPTANDNCAVNSPTNDAPSVFYTGSTYVTWTVADDAGNFVTCQQRVTVKDTTNPTITCPGAAALNAGVGCVTFGTAIGTATAADNCGTPTLSTNAPGQWTTTGTFTVTHTATDKSGNTATCDQSVVITDATNPLITCPTFIFKPADAACKATVTMGSPTTSDNCGVSTVAASLNGNAISQASNEFSAPQNTVTWAVTDNAGLTATCDQTVSLVDVTKPTITCPADVTVSSGSSCTKALADFDLGTPTVADNCHANTPTNDAPATFYAGSTYVTWTVLDDAANFATCQQRVTVQDTTNPTITCPADASLNAGQGCKTSSTLIGAASGADNCGTPTLTSNAPIEFTAAGAFTVTHTATDKSGNTVTCDQTVTITDTTGPAVVCPSFVLKTADATCQATVNLGSPIASDNCGVASTAASTGGNAIADTTAQVFGLSTSTVSWTVTDTVGLTATCSQSVTVLDNTKPTITCPADVTVSSGASCTVALADVTLGTPTIADNCAGSTTSNDAPTTFSAGTTIVTWTVTDASSNFATCQQRVTVPDTTNPTITCPADVTRNPDTTCRTASATIGVATGADNCGTPTITSDAPFEWTTTGTFVVTYTATDKSGNTATCAQTVVVTDVALPSLTCPGTKIAAAGANCNAQIDFGTPTSSDNCGIQSVVTTNALASNIYPKGTNTVTWRATDTSGLQRTCTQTIIVTDSDPVSIKCPVDVTFSANNACKAQLTTTNLGTPTTSASCGGVTLRDNRPTNGVFSLGSTPVLYTATDSLKYQALCTQYVNVVDRTNPMITCPLNVTAIASTSCTAFPALGTPMTADNCGVVSVTSNAAFPYSPGTYNIVWVVRDASGLNATCTQRLTVTAPAGTTCPSGSGGNILSVGGASGSMTTASTAPTPATATATDPLSALTGLAINPLSTAGSLLPGAPNLVGLFGKAPGPLGGPGAILPNPTNLIPKSGVFGKAAMATGGAAGIIPKLNILPTMPPKPNAVPNAIPPAVPTLMPKVANIGSLFGQSKPADVIKAAGASASAKATGLFGPFRKP